MSQINYKQNTFDRGMYTDAHPGLQPDGTYLYALNAKTNTLEWDSIGLTNEISTTLLAQGLETVHGATLIEERDEWVIFHTKGGASTISLLNHETGKVREVMNDQEFGCDWGFDSCEYIYAESKVTTDCNELFIYFSSKCKYYVVNVDEMLDPGRRECKICDDFCLFLCTCVPEIRAKVSGSVGGDLDSGIYQFSAQLQDRDGHTTNWFWVSEPLSIGSQSNVAGTPSNQGITVTVSDLDPRYEIVNIAVIKTIGGVTTQEVISSRSYNTNGISVFYYGQKGEDILLEEILTKRRTWIEGQDLIQKDGRLFLYNTKQRRNLNYQSRANQITTHGVVYAVRMEDAWKYPSLSRGEVYAPGISWNHCDGTSTFGFHVPYNPGTLSNPLDVDKFFENTKPADSAGDRGGSSSTYVDYYDTVDDSLEKEDLGEEDLQDDLSDDIEGGNDILDDVINEEEVNVDGCCGGVQQLNGRVLCEGCNTDWWSRVQDWFNAVFSDDDTAPADVPIVTEIITERGTRYIDQDGNPVDINSLPTDSRGRRRRRARSRRGSAFNQISDFISPADGRAGPARGNSVKSDYEHEDIPFNNIHEQPTLPGNPEVHVLGEIQFELWESEETYPDQCDCEGNPIYGDLTNKQQRFFRVPDEGTIPHYVSYANGVRSKKRPGVEEWKDSYAILIGPKFSNIEYPDEEELHTPLCEEQPFRMLYVERDEANSSVVAKGLATHTFTGRVNGRDMAIPKHGVNSIETVDRHILREGANEYDLNSRLGTQHDTPIYNLHSPDTSVGSPAIRADNVLFTGICQGIGYRHGLYARGEEPISTFAPRFDQRGTRSSVNLSEFFRSPFFTPLLGISYAPGNKIITNIEGIDKPLMNLYRESSVVFQSNQLGPFLPGGHGIQNSCDHSFYGDGLIHSRDIAYAGAHYITLLRENPSQYGGVATMRYVDMGLNASKDQGNSIEGIAGDVYIGPWTVRRTSYVSNKLGEEDIIPPESNTKPFARWLGFGNASENPDPLDTTDVKNRITLRDNHNGTPGGEPSRDTYYPRTQKTLVTFIVESRVNTHFRETGDLEGEVYYDNLKSLELDSAINEVPWPKAWLNRFYQIAEITPQWKINLRAGIRIGLIVFVIALVIRDVLELAFWLDLPMLILRGLAIVILGALALELIFNRRNLNRWLRIPIPRSDKQGGQDDAGVEQWEDNYTSYNFDHSQPNQFNITYGIPNPYYTCDCDDCLEDETTNEIYISDKQILDSPIDAYRNFQANQYFELPAHAGNITRLFIRSNRMYAHTTDNIWMIQMRNSESDFENVNLYLTPQGLLALPDEFMEHVPEGFGGLRHWTHAINTITGYYFVDEEARKIYRFNGPQDMDEITVFGMRNFFKENLKFCSENDCIGELSPKGIGYALGYDHRHNRLLFTKRDGKYSYTVSFDPQRKAWISFHSYIPQFYLWNRRNLYSLRAGEVWTHEEKEGNYQTFYGKSYPHIIEYSSKHPGLVPGELNFVSFYTQANIKSASSSFPDIYSTKCTFNRAIFYNNTQTSGELLLELKWDGDPSSPNPLDLSDQITETKFTVPVIWQGEEWRINQIRDYTKDISQPIWIKPDCVPFKVFNSDNIDPDKQWIENNIIFDRYLVARLIFDKDCDTQLITKYALVQDSIPMQ